ncbi:MAG: ABC transporter, partial [Flavobacteriaceae bacterium]
GTTLVIITHDLELAKRNQQIIRLKGGRLVANESTAVL